MKRVLSIVMALCMLFIATAAVAESVYPMEGDYNFTYFGKLHTKVSKSYSGLEELGVVQDWFKATGASLTFLCPPSGMEAEQFNMMLASGDYADIINYDFANGVPGGLQKAYNDGVIVDLTPYLAEYAPNYSAYLDAHPMMKKEIMDDEGRIFCFIFSQQEENPEGDGPIYRDDILAELGLEAPVTIDQWETVLKAVKEAYPEMIPWTGSTQRLQKTFGPAYGVGIVAWFVDDDGVARYAPGDPDVKGYLEKMAEWYALGLIDTDYISLDDPAADNKMKAGDAFASFGANSAQLLAYLNANKDNPTYSVSGVQRPTLVEGDLPKYCHEWRATNNAQFVISTKCKNVEAAVRMYDWGFSEEGNIRLNWGIEGESYEIGEDGQRHYTELIYNNPDGKDQDTILEWYAIRNIKAPAAMEINAQAFTDLFKTEQQINAAIEWSKKDNSYYFPPVNYVGDQADDLADLMIDISTYAESMLAKFIMGTESLDNFDAYLATLNSMGLQDAIAIQQDAANRFNNRGN